VTVIISHPSPQLLGDRKRLADPNMKFQVLSSLLAVLSQQKLYALAQGNSDVNFFGNYVG
jgi:hypothetical protein